MILAYEALDGAGKKVADSIEAADARQAAEQLRRQGLFITRIGEVKAPALMPSKTVTTAKKLPRKELVLVTRQMAMLLRAGSAVVPALQSIKRNMHNAQHAALMGKIIKELEEGVTLTEALREQPDTFDPSYCAAVAAGEASANLTGMFDRLAGVLARRQALRNKVLGALAYPALLVMISIKIILVMLLFVVPRFSAMFEQLGVEVPVTTQYLLSFSEALSSNWIVVVLAAVAGVGGVIWTLSTSTGRQWLANIQLSIPLIGTLRRRLIEAQLLRTMGMLLECHVGVLDTIDLARGVTKNERFARMFDNLIESVTSGRELSAAFDQSKLIEPYVCQAIRTGESSGNLGGAITYAADILDETNAELLNTATKLIEPIVLIIMGVIVGGVAMSLFMPLFDLTAAMG